MSQYAAHHARVNQRQSVTQYVARHAKLRGSRPAEHSAAGRHALFTGKATRSGMHRGGVLGRFLFLMMFLGGAIAVLTSPIGRARGDHTARYATPELPANETTLQLGPLYK